MSDLPRTRSEQGLLEPDSVFARLRARLVAVPAWASLAGLVALSFGIRLALSRGYPAPWVFPDEVTYAELSRSFADSGSFEIRGDPAPGFSRVYPALISPAYALFDNQAHAYAAAKAINALVMSLVAVPVYLLARRLVRPGLALLAAALSLAIPSMFYSSLIMTESAFYPIFALFALVLVLVLERPTALRQTALLAVAVLAYYTRAQAVLVVPATVTAIALLALAESWREAPGARLRAFLRRARTFWVVWLGGIVGAAAVVAAQLAQGRPLGEFLGVYESVASTASYSGGDVARWFLYDLVDLDLAFGVVPLAAFILVAASGLRRGAVRPLRAFSAASIGLVLWLLVAVAAFNAGFADRLEERFVFHVAPLLFIALVVWVDGFGVDDWRLRAAAALVVATVPLAFPFGELLRWEAVADSFGLWPLSELLTGGYTAAEITLVVAFGLLALGLAFVLLRGRYRLVVPALLLVVFAVVSLRVDDRMRQGSTSALQAGIGQEREWIDDAIGPDAEAISIWTANDVHADWQNEFFNRSLGRSYFLTYVPDSLPSDGLTLTDDGRLLEEGSRPVEAQYAVVDRAFDLVGEQVAADPVLGTKVFRLDGPLRLRRYLGGIFPDRYSGPTLTYVRYGCRGGELDVALTQNALLISVPQTVTATSGGRVVARATVAPTAVDQPLRIPLAADDYGRCTVDFAISPTAVPNDVLGNGDLRQLGVQFSRLDYVPAG